MSDSDTGAFLGKSMDLAVAETGPSFAQSTIRLQLYPWTRCYQVRQTDLALPVREERSGVG